MHPKYNLNYFNFNLLNKNNNIIDIENYFDKSFEYAYNYIDINYYKNGTISSVNNYTINYLKNGLFRFIGKLSSFSENAIDEWSIICTSYNKTKEYRIKFDSNLKQEQYNIIISQSKSNFYIYNSDAQINQDIYIYVELKDIKNRFVSDYSFDIERYKSLILVEARNYFNTSIIKNFEYDSFDYAHKYLKYKYNFSEEGKYIINVTFEGINFKYDSTNIIKIPLSKYTFSLNDSILEIIIDNKIEEMDLESTFKLNNSKYPIFKLLLYNLDKDKMIYDSDVAFSCYFSDQNYYINWELDKSIKNDSILFSFNEESLNNYKNLETGNYSLIINANNNIKIFNLFLLVPEEPEESEKGKESINIESDKSYQPRENGHCFFNCSNCGLSYIMVKNGQCQDNCSTIDYFSGICQIYSEAPLYIKSNMAENIRSNILNKNLNSLITNKIYGEHSDLLMREGNIVFQITSSYNQMYNDYENISIINLGECESRIRDFYNMDNNENLVIFKIEYYEEGLLIPIIEYEIYNIDDGIKIDLDICKDTDIQLLIPVLINENELLFLACNYILLFLFQNHIHHNYN